MGLNLTVSHFFIYILNIILYFVIPPISSLDSKENNIFNNEIETMPGWNCLNELEIWVRYCLNELEIWVTYAQYAHSITFHPDFKKPDF